MEKKLFKQAFILLFLIGTADILGISFYLFWTIWFFDVVLHFLAGVCIAMGAVASWFIIFSDKNRSFLRVFFIGMAFVFFVGIIWEVFETYFDVTMLSDGREYYVDTISDLILDIFGGLLGSIYSFKLLSKGQ